MLVSTPRVDWTTTNSEDEREAILSPLRHLVSERILEDDLRLPEDEGHYSICSGHTCILLQVMNV